MEEIYRAQINSEGAPNLSTAEMIVLQNEIEKDNNVSTTEAIELLFSIKRYMCSGNPIWNTDVVEEAMNMAILALIEKAK